MGRLYLPGDRWHASNLRKLLSPSPPNYHLAVVPFPLSRLSLEGLCQRRESTHSPPLIASSLPVSHYPMTQLSRLSVEAIAEQQRPSILLMPPPSPHLFLNSLRTKEVQH
ncbi:hypothetical protein ABVK25_001931 [Lepraria finkii]|uniref:Uncharacterized protein n=1 Tax=Lepraria finkii TaxID=1340010 RepID=A0ABR4BI88_9LECA